MQERPSASTSLVIMSSAAYSPSKSALTALTVQYANELRKDGILVNAVAPGFVDTDSNNHTGVLTVAQGAAVVVLFGSQHCWDDDCVANLQERALPQGALQHRVGFVPVARQQALVEAFVRLQDGLIAEQYL